MRWDLLSDMQITTLVYAFAAPRNYSITVIAEDSDLDCTNEFFTTADGLYETVYGEYCKRQLNFAVFMGKYCKDCLENV